METQQGSLAQKRPTRFYCPRLLSPQCILHETTTLTVKTLQEGMSLLPEQIERKIERKAAFQQTGQNVFPQTLTQTLKLVEILDRSRIQNDCSHQPKQFFLERE